MGDPVVIAKCGEVAACYRELNDGTTEEQFRAMKESANNVKKTLPVVMFQAHFRDGKRCNASAELSPWATLDVDGIENPRELWEQVREKADSQGINIPVSFISPSGRGLKVVFQRPEGMGIPEAQEWFARCCGIDDYDKSTKDAARCTYMVGRENFLHYDPDMLFAEEVEPYYAPMSEEVVESTASDNCTKDDAEKEKWQQVFDLWL